MADQEGTTAEEVLLYLIAQLVEHPDQVELEIEESDTKPVSYTHLTLPTNREV